MSSDRAGSALVGIRAGRVLTGGWALAAALGTLAGCLLASRLILSPDMMVRLLVYAFAAATIGGLTSMGGALVGGLLVGVSQTMLAGYVPFVRGPLSLPAVLALMVIMLAFRPAGLFGRTGAGPNRRTTRSPSRPASEAAGPLDDPAGQLHLAAVPGRHHGRAGLSSSWPGFALPVAEARLWTEVVATAVVLWGLGLLIGPPRAAVAGPRRLRRPGRLLHGRRRPPATAGRRVVGVALAGADRLRRRLCARPAGAAHQGPVPGHGHAQLRRRRSP